MWKQPHSVKFSQAAARVVKEAAKKRKMTFSAFVEAAAEKEAREILDRKICKTCGRMHDT